MQNVTLDRKGDTLVITIDLSKNLGPSKSGKTTLIATTEGNVSVPGAGDTKLGLNLYKSR